MTEGPLGDEIVIGVTTQVTGNVQAAIQEIFQQIRSETSRGGDLGAIELPAADPQVLINSVRTALSEIESQVTTVAGNIGARLQEGFGGGGDLFASQKEALREYQEQWRQFAVQMETITSGNAFSRRGAQAVPSDPAAAMQRAVAQYNQVQGRGSTDSASAYYLSEESRRAIESGQIVPPPNRQAFLKSVSGSAYTPGDVEKVIGQVQASIAKVALDGVSYSFNADTGQFASRGRVVTDPAKISQLVGSLSTQMATAAETAVRSQFISASGGVDLGASPLSRLGPTDVYTHELAAPIAASRTPQEAATAIEGLLTEFRHLESQVGQTLPQLQRLRQILDELRNAAAQPFMEDYRAGRQSQLEAALGGSVVNPGVLGDEAGLKARQLAQDEAARQQQITEYQSRNPVLAIGGRPSRLAISASPFSASSQDAGDIEARTLQHTQDELNRVQQSIVEFKSRGTEAMQSVAQATEQADAAMQQLSRIVALTGEQLVKISAGVKLTREELAGLRSAGSLFEGQAAATSPSGGHVFQFSPAGALSGDPIERESALIRLQMQQQSEAAKQQEALVAAGGGGSGGGGGGGVFAAFGRGLFGGAGGGGNSLERVQKAGGEFLGSIARYQVAYAAIFAVQRAIQGAISEQAQFEEAQVPLQAALDGTNAKLIAVANSYADIGTASGQSAATGIAAGTQGIFAFQAQGTPQAQQVGAQSAKAAMTALVLTGGQLVEVQQELIASTNAFNLGYEGQSRVLDAATNSYHHYGEAIGSILQALPAVAEQARQAGLSVEQTTNLISLVGETTQATGEAAGTALGRIFVQMNSSNYQLQARSLGINPTATQGQQLEELAKKWHTLDTAQQNALVHSLTGARGASALIAILQDGGKALSQNASAYGAAGVAQQEYYHQLGTLGGQLKIIRGDFSGLSKDLAQSGVGDIFGLALRSIDPFLHGLDDILKVFDAIDGSSHHLIGTIAELAGVYLLLAKAAQAAAVGEGEAAAVGSGGLLARAGSLLRAPFGRRAATVAGDAALAGPELGAAGLGAGEVAAPELATGAAFLGPVGLAIAGGVALTTVMGGLIQSAHRQTDAHNQAIQAEKELFSATTADQFKTAASDLATASVDLRHAGSGFFGFLGGGADNGQIDRNAANARFAEAQAAALLRYQSQTGQSSNAYFTDPNDFTNNIRSGLAAMTEAGVPATRQLELLTVALQGTAVQAQHTGQILNSPPVRTPLINTVASLKVTDSAAGLLGNVGDGLLGHFVAPPQLNTLLRDALRRRGIGENQPISSKDQAAIIDQLAPQIANAYGAAVLGPDRPTYTEGRDGRLIAHSNRPPIDFAEPQIRAALQHFFTSQITGPARVGGLRNSADIATFFQGPTDPANPNSGPNAQLSGFQAIQDRFTASQNALNPEQSAQGARAAITAIRTALDAAKKFNKPIFEAFAAQGYSLIDQWVKQVGANIAAVATAAGRNKSPEEAAKAAATGIEKEGIFFVKQGDQGQLVTLLDSANTMEINAIKQYFQQRLKDAKDALAAAQQQLQSDLSSLDSLPSGLKDPQLRQDILGPDNASTNAAGRLVKKFIDELGLITGSNYVGTDQSAGSKASIAEAQALAAARAGDAVSQAKAQLDADHIALQSATKSGDLAGIANAQKAIKSDILSLHQAEAALGQSAAALSEIPGDPVSQAAGELKTAAAALAAAVTGTADYNTALKAYRDAQYQMHEALIEANYQGTLANIDQTDPVATAKAQVQRDRHQLRFDRRRGAGSDVINTDLAALHRDRATEQSSRFSQNLNDMQNAYNLQEISASAYIKFLDHEHDVLSRIAHRTRQQTEELQQVDQALKSVASAMDGQFNIGDIHIPTPYEAQRYIQAHSQGLGYQSTAVTHSTDNRQYRLDFKGLDKREIEELLGYLLGSNTTHRSGTATRKGM